MEQGGLLFLHEFVVVVVVVVVVVLTLTDNTMQSVVAGQAPIILEWKKYWSCPVN